MLFSVALPSSTLRAQAYAILGTGSPERPPRLSHSSWALSLVWFKFFSSSLRDLACAYLHKTKQTVQAERRKQTVCTWTWFVVRRVGQCLRLRHRTVYFYIHFLLVWYSVNFGMGCLNKCIRNWSGSRNLWRFVNIFVSAVNLSNQSSSGDGHAAINFFFLIISF